MTHEYPNIHNSAIDSFWNEGSSKKSGVEDRILEPCRGVTTPTPFMDFWQRSLYRARIAFLWGAMAISKNEDIVQLVWSSKIQQTPGADDWGCHNTLSAEVYIHMQHK